MAIAFGPLLFLVAWTFFVICNEMHCSLTGDLWFPFGRIYFTSSLVSLICGFVAVAKEPRTRMTWIALALSILNSVEAVVVGRAVRIF
jgi:hypothetical protein